MEFGLMGRLVVRCGETVLVVPPGKQRAVLAVLLIRTGQVVPIDELIDLIWAGDPPRSARVTLHNYVRRLRHVLSAAGQPAPVKTSWSGYLVETAADELDVTRFRALCDSGRKAADRKDWGRAAAELGVALSLWRGQPLMDIPCPRLTDVEAPHLIAMRIAALEDRIDADLHLGRHREVVAELQRLAEAEPLREHVHAQLMLALYRSARQADALAAYQRARGALVSELALEPGLELRRMHHQILNADPVLDYRAGSAADYAAGSAGAG
jgi:DNA-binding SARP family transcriptional activator